MKIEQTYDEKTRTIHFHIEISYDYIIEKCEDYAPIGSPLMESLTPEQGFGIIADAALLALRLKLKKEPI